MQQYQITGRGAFSLQILQLLLSKHQHSQFSPQSPDVTLSTSDDDNNNTSRSDRPVVHAPPLSPPSTMRTSIFYSPSISSPTYWEAGHL